MTPAWSNSKASEPRRAPAPPQISQAEAVAVAIIPAARNINEIVRIMRLHSQLSEPEA